MDNQNNRIKISDVYYKLGQLDSLNGAIKRIETKLDQIAEDHEKRIETLENERFYIKGKLTVVGVIAGFLGSLGLVLLKMFIGK